MGEIISSSQTKKWKGWIVGLQLANNTQLQLTTLFLLFWQKTTENSNSSTACLFFYFCFTASGHGEFLPAGWQALWNTWHLKSLMVHKAHWNKHRSTTLAFRSSQPVRYLLTQAPFYCPKMLLMHLTESPHWHIFLLSPAQKPQQSHRTEHTPKGSGGYSLAGTADMGEHMKQAGWMFPVGWLVWLGFGFFFSCPTPTFYHI